MSLSERSSSERNFPAQRSSPAEKSLLTENRLLAAIAICFLMLHIIAGVVLIQSHQNEAAPSSEQITLSPGD